MNSQKIDLLDLNIDDFTIRIIHNKINELTAFANSLTPMEKPGEEDRRKWIEHWQKEYKAITPTVYPNCECSLAQPPSDKPEDKPMTTKEANDYVDSNSESGEKECFCGDGEWEDECKSCPCHEPPTEDREEAVPLCETTQKHGFTKSSTPYCVHCKKLVIVTLSEPSGESSAEPETIEELDAKIEIALSEEAPKNVTALDDFKKLVDKMPRIIPNQYISSSHEFIDTCDIYKALQKLEGMKR